MICERNIILNTCGVLKQYNPEAGDSVMSTIFSTLIHTTDTYEYVLKKFSWMNAGIAWNDYISCKHESIILKSVFSCTYSFHIHKEMVVPNKAKWNETNMKTQKVKPLTESTFT